MTTDDGASALLTGRTPTSSTGPVLRTPTTRALLACVVFVRSFVAWGERGLTVYSAATGAAFAFVFASMAFGQVEGLVAFGGVLQRMALTIGWACLTLLAVHVLRQGDGRTDGTATP